MAGKRLHSVKAKLKGVLRDPKRPLEARQPPDHLPNIADRALDQHQSRLFQLPAELKEIIWTYAVLTSRPLCLHSRNRRMVYSPQLWSGWMTADAPLFMCNGLPQWFQALDLVKSCRRIYVEAIHLLYSINTFKFEHAETFVELPRFIPSNTLRFITRVRLVMHVVLATDENCVPVIQAAMKALPSLKRLEILFGPNWTYFDDEVECDRWTMEGGGSGGVMVVVAMFDGLIYRDRGAWVTGNQCRDAGAGAGVGECWYEKNVTQFIDRMKGKITAFDAERAAQNRPCVKFLNEMGVGGCSSRFDLWRPDF